MPVYTHSYDSDYYDPAMSVVEIGLLSTASEEHVVTMVAVVDLGADATMIPINSLESAGSRYYGTRRMRGITGQSVPVDTYFAVIQIGPYIIRGIKAVAIPIDGEPILGRDVLNQLELTLNGPAQELWID